jgi:hypothetical protein
MPNGENPTRAELAARIAEVLVERDWVAQPKAQEVSENLVELMEELGGKEAVGKDPLLSQPRVCPTCDGTGKVMPWLS